MAGHMRRLPALLCLIVAGVVGAQGLYKYRDADGNWVYTDRQPDTVQDYEQIPLADSAVSQPVVRVERRTADSTRPRSPPAEREVSISSIPPPGACWLAPSAGNTATTSFSIRRRTPRWRRAIWICC